MPRIVWPVKGRRLQQGRILFLCAKAMHMNRPRISVFPKCYFDELYSGKMSYLAWLRDAATLGAEGVEHYDGFFRSFDDAGIEPVRRTLRETGQISSMLCFSP